MRLIAWILAFLIINEISSDVPNAHDVRVAYDSFVRKFKKEDVHDGFALTHIGGFWQSIETAEVFIDAYERFKDDETKQNMIDVVDSFINAEGEDWKDNPYNDDIIWGFIMLLRIYIHVKNDRYLDIAIYNFNMVWDRAWNDNYEGGLLWFHGKTEKNACVNGPAAIAACYIAIHKNDEAYYEKAESIIRWMNKWLLQDDGGLSDKVDWNSEKNEYEKNNWVSTYNQGTYLGACNMLYQHTKNEEFLDMAKKAAYRATIIQDILDGEDAGGDLIGFKGILGRWLSRLVKDQKINDYNEWINNNVNAAWTNRNSDNLMWTKFGTKTEKNIENSSDDTKRNETAWGCSSALSWLINLAAL